MRILAALLVSLPVALAGSAAPQGQDELKLEYVFTKIEGKAAAVPSLAADISFAMKDGGEQFRVTGRLESTQGKAFRRQFGIWVPSEGMLAAETFWSPTLAGSKVVFWSSREGSFFTAVKCDPSRPAALKSSYFDYLLMMFGGEWTLADVVLCPRQLLIGYKELSVTRHKEGEKNYVGIVGERKVEEPGGRGENVRTTWLFDAATIRLERVELEVAGEKHAGICDRFAQVNGVEIPEHIVFSLGMGRMSGLEITLFNFDTRPEASLSKAPAWSEDTGIPVATADTEETLREKLKKEPENASLAVSLIGAIVANDIKEREAFKKSIAELIPSLERISKANPESAAVSAALYCGYLTAQKQEAADKLAADLAEKKSACPEVQLLRSIGFIAAKKFKEATSSLDLLPSDLLFPGIKPVLRFSCRASLAADAKELASAVDEECKGKDIAQRIQALGILEPAPARYGRGGGILTEKGTSVLEEFAKSDKPELQLLAARAYAGQAKGGQSKEAVEIYLKLATNKEWLPHLKTELQTVCLLAKQDAAKLIEILFDDLTDPDLLIAAAESYFDAKEQEKCDRAVKKAVQRLGEEAKTRNYRYRETDAVTAFLRKLVEGGKTSSAKELLLAYADKQSASRFLHGHGNEEQLVSKILGEDKEALYDFLKNAGANTYSMGQLNLKAADVLTLLKKRMQSSPPQESDVELAGLFVSDDALRQEAKLEDLAGYFEQGIKAYPKRAEFSERLGDVHTLTQAFAKAVPCYQAALKAARESGAKTSDYAPVSKARAMAVEKEGREPQRDPSDFQITWPVIVKLVHASVKNNDRDGAIKQLEQFLKGFPDDESTVGAASQAYDRLELSDRASALKKKLFLKQAKSSNAKYAWSAETVIATGVDLAKRLIKDKKFGEAFVVCEMLAEAAKVDVKDDYGFKKRIDEVRREVLKNYTNDDLIREFCEGKFAPLSEEKKKEVKDLIEQLDSDDLSTRDAAAEKLRAVMPDAAPLLRNLMKDQSAEVTRRLEALLTEFAAKALRERFQQP